MSKQFSVSTLFKAIDNLSKPVEHMGNKINRFATSTNRASASVDVSMRKVDRAAENASRGINKLNAARLDHFKFQVVNSTSKVKDLTSAVSNLLGKTRSFGSSLLPGMGSLATGALVGYAGYQGLQNSSRYEDIEVTTKGLIQSSPAFKEKLSSKQMDDLASKVGRLAEVAGNVSVGQFRDYAQMANVNLARGIAPDERLMKAYGALAAAMPSMDDKAGQFLETLKSLNRGEMATSDNIPGVKGHIDRKTHEAYLMHGGNRYDLGAPDAPDYSKVLNSALIDIAEKNFSKLGELQGQTFEAKWSTMESTITRGLDDTLRKTQWWEKSIKPALDGVTDSVEKLTPKFVSLSDTIYNKMVSSGVFGQAGQNIETFIGGIVDKMNAMIGSLDDRDIIKVRDDLLSAASAFGQLSSALVEFIPTLTNTLKFLAHPIDYLNNKVVDNAVNYAEEKGYKEISLGQRSGLNIIDNLPFSLDMEEYRARANAKLAENRETKQRTNYEIAKTQPEIPTGVLNTFFAKLEAYIPQSVAISSGQNKTNIINRITEKTKESAKNFTEKSTEKTSKLTEKVTEKTSKLTEKTNVTNKFSEFLTKVDPKPFEFSKEIAPTLANTLDKTTQLVSVGGETKTILQGHEAIFNSIRATLDNGFNLLSSSIQGININVNNMVQESTRQLTMLGPTKAKAELLAQPKIQNNITIEQTHNIAPGKPTISTSKVSGGNAKVSTVNTGKNTRVN